ncbi:hypothetical protein E4P40_19435 [Blastococcus sp. CT_GayMR20]|uniref:hypothetical protein n=1 Tax=Blastococcus sp. CT_GayMR20 TaxID=2559609 RepID=UPI0010749DD8|nr:hypothetical protein [Blastococcus sp. CT_GayMR20]TFV75370.1 hypothetical protein E4P40_19435 [Blastococcus sp. CT_GayMR20]
MSWAEHVWRDLDAPRAPSDHERRIIATLVQAVGEPLLQEQVTSVVIDAVCRCGCSSMRLRTDSAAVPADTVSKLSSRCRPDYFAVDASGRDPGYQDVNVVLHLLGGRVGELEVFDAVKGEGAAVALDGLAGLTEPTVS